MMFSVCLRILRTARLHRSHSWIVWIPNTVLQRATIHFACQWAPPFQYHYTLVGYHSNGPPHIPSIVHTRSKSRAPLRFIRGAANSEQPYRFTNSCSNSKRSLCWMMVYSIALCSMCRPFIFSHSMVMNDCDCHHEVQYYITCTTFLHSRHCCPSKRLKFKMFFVKFSRHARRVVVITCRSE